MASLLQRTRMTGLALALALGLTVLPGLVAPLLGDELSSTFPIVHDALAEHQDGGG